MPGPLPKDPKIRQRTNKSATRALLPAETAPILKAPRLPNHPDSKGWHNMARLWWRDVWASPMRFEFLRGDLPALLRLVMLVDTFWREQELDVAREIRLLEREFGLTPLSRRRLEWSVAQAEEAKDLHEQKRSKRAIILDNIDPGKILEG